MNWSKAQNQQKLQSIYGMEFPNALFSLHEFLVECEEKSDSVELSALRLHPSGVLKLLLSFDNLSEAKFTHDSLLHWRFYRDVPEFFTYLHGKCDGQHWGMLLDNPSQ